MENEPVLSHTELEPLQLQFSLILYTLGL